MRNPAIKKGQYLLCFDASGYPQFSEGKVYIAAKDQEPGIFRSRPFLQVANVEAPSYTIGVCHPTRFIPVAGPGPYTREQFKQYLEAYRWSLPPAWPTS